jgi:hypothetical protein
MPKTRDKPKHKPERKITLSNGIGVAVWTNEIQTDNGPRKVRTISINPRRYYDRESDEWRDASGFNPADLPALIFALNQALEHCFTVPLPDEESEHKEGGNGSTASPAF